ncbi:hypothetical protein CEXT_207971 [Caerostris extrusa]|uniref:Uncharacterized protein n=1 Tax=Caerostris extrusa TaxID=172846 RepID=A0AAV4TYF7_CAEEX|nr:hypothetical protein CEXT_207971 [Caerostris extrusa]
MPTTEKSADPQAEQKCIPMSRYISRTDTGTFDPFHYYYLHYPPIQINSNLDFGSDVKIYHAHSRNRQSSVRSISYPPFKNKANHWALRPMSFAFIKVRGLPVFGSQNKERLGACKTSDVTVQFSCIA